MMNNASETASLQALILSVGRELFAIDAAMVREILDPVPTTPVPGARAYVPWLINVRGNVLPLVDLKVRFRLATQDTTIDTRFVVLRTEIHGDMVNVAIVADKVFEVVTVSHLPLAETTKMGLRLPPELIASVGRWRDGIVLVPDMGRVLH